jgi:putative tricarboxylic transport membrane protein
MDIFLTALDQVFSFGPIAAIIIGTFFGIIIGAIPGLGSVVGISICLPFTFGMDAITSISLLLGVYCGSVYGGSISAVMINSPGTPQSAATVLEGYPMAQAGQAGKALGWATMSSVIGGLISCLVLIIAAPQLARVATQFGSVEIFSLIVLALTCIATVSAGAMTKGLLMGVIGLFLSQVGTDPISGIPRFTFGSQFLSSGLDLISVVVGLFALSEAFARIGFPEQEETTIEKTRLVLPKLSEWKGRIGHLLRSSGIGCLIGALPGTGASTAAFISYAVAKRSSKNSDNFGKGEPDGLIAAESSNNAVTGSAMIPTLALGIPGDVITAILMSALIIQGITPGVRLMAENAVTVDGIFISLILINLAMLVLAFPLVRLFGKLLLAPQSLIVTGIFGFVVLGTMTVRGNPLDAVVAVICGIAGLILRRGGYPLAPLVIGLVLGPELEQNLNRGLMIYDNNFFAMIASSWIAIAIFAAVVVLVLWPIVAPLVRPRAEKVAAR